MDTQKQGGKDTNNNRGALVSGIYVCHHLAPVGDATDILQRRVIEGNADHSENIEEGINEQEQKHSKIA
ncbi:hypothetical protein SDC9_75234 [bioreactor metagenome]|uniref:Uncharacterized protein n=1 Tax=bioreactor metagenome TaxID=1076179 RepID=A0A644YJP8_9ZZZZ